MKTKTEVPTRKKDLNKLGLIAEGGGVRVEDVKKLVEIEGKKMFDLLVEAYKIKNTTTTRNKK